MTYTKCVPELSGMQCSCAQLYQGLLFGPRIEAGILKTAFYNKCCWTKCFHSKSFDR